MVRPDLQHLIIDTGRAYCGGSTRVRDDDMDVERGPMRNVHGKYPDDRLSPLLRYLRKQVGRPWRLVYSELSRAFDKRSLRGHHLHGHVTQIVAVDQVVKTPKGYRRITPLYGGDDLFDRGELFVDEHGLLRRPRPHEMRTRTAERARRVAVREAFERQRVRTAGGVYLKVDGLWWFVVPASLRNREAWPGHPKAALFDTDSLSFRWRPATEIERFDRRAWYLPREKRQVSRRQIKREGLER